MILRKFKNKTELHDELCSFCSGILAIPEVLMLKQIKPGSRIVLTDKALTATHSGITQTFRPSEFLGVYVLIDMITNSNKYK